MERHNQMHSPLLTDFYQVTMAFSYFQQQRHLSSSVFDVFYRKNPFKGHFTLFCGVEDVKEFIRTYHFKEQEVCYIAKQLGIESTHGFADFLRAIEKEAKDVKIYALPEGSVASPKIPLIRIEGPLAVVQLLETPILAMTGFSSLVATNAARICSVAQGRSVMEFGLRRAQGADGGMTASKYAVLGGCSSSSNVFAGFRDQVTIAGTMAHSFICGFQHTTEAFSPNGDSKYNSILDVARKIKKFCESKPEWKKRVAPAKGSGWSQDRWDQLRDSELNAFATYAIDFPTNFLALVDTYDTVRSGGSNFLYVAAALIFQGFIPRGIRLDSGDLAQLARDSRELFDYFFKNIFPGIIKKFDQSKNKMAAQFLNGGAKKMVIVASNDLHEEAVKELLKDDPKLEIDVFGIGTHLATCKAQPALGMVYKLVEIDGHPCVKFSQEEIKQTYPSRKNAFRLYKGNKPVGDVLCLKDERIEEKSVLFSNQNFKPLQIDFDYVQDLYTDDFAGLGLKEDMNFSDALEKLASIERSFTAPQKALRKGALEYIQGLGKETGVMTKMEFLKAKVEARKSLFDLGTFSSKAKENPEFDYPVLITEGLRAEIKKAKGGSDVKAKL